MRTGVTVHLDPTDRKRVQAIVNDRTSPQKHVWRAKIVLATADQLRLVFSGFAYVLLEALRRVALKHTQLADASVHTIRLKLLKLGARVRTSVRRIHFAIASSCPNQIEFEMAHLYLRRAFGSG